MSNAIFLSKTEKIAQALSRRLKVPVHLHQKSSFTDGVQLWLDLRYGNYDGELKQYYDGVTDHEIGHLIFSEFVNPNAKKVLTDQNAIKLFQNGNINFITQHLEDLRINIVTLESEIHKLEHDNSFLVNDIYQLNKEMSEEEEKYLLKASKASSIESEVSKIEYKLDLTLERFMDEYSLDLENAKNLKDQNCDTSKSHIDRLKKSINSLGNVNMDSIEEYKKTNERYTFYKEQKADLEDSVIQIKNIIDELEKNMVTEFNSSLYNINTKFDEVFKILFGGGSAKLVMRDPSNLLESEIEINVQPPGKKVRSVSMLSGGEKALCSIAILFSIL